MDRPLSPTRSNLQVSDGELVKRSAPGGRMPVKGAKNNALGDKAYTPIHDASAAAIAAKAEREGTRAKPELAAKRERAGK